MRKELNKQLYFIKEDLIKCTTKSNREYHTWINKNRINIFPFVETNDSQNNLKLIKNRQ